MSSSPRIPRVARLHTAERETGAGGADLVESPLPEARIGLIVGAGDVTLAPGVGEAIGALIRGADLDQAVRHWYLWGAEGRELRGAECFDKAALISYALGLVAKVPVDEALPVIVEFLRTGDPVAVRLLGDVVQHPTATVRKGWKAPEPRECSCGEAFVLEAHLEPGEGWGLVHICADEGPRCEDFIDVDYPFTGPATPEDFRRIGARTT